MSVLTATEVAAPPVPPGGFDVEYIAGDGTKHRVPLAAAAGVSLADMTPARRLQARKGQQNLPGRW